MAFYNHLLTFLTISILFVEIWTQNMPASDADYYDTKDEEQMELVPELEDDELIADRIHNSKRFAANGNNENADEIWRPSAGVLSNLEEFFDDLKTNMVAIDDKKPAYGRYLYGDIITEEPILQKPSYKIRKFLQSPELGSLKGANNYDPSLLWTGLGKRNAKRVNFNVH